MKISEIQVGKSYHHGTGKTCRRVTNITTDYVLALRRGGHVVATVLYTQYTSQDKLIEGCVSLASFAKWAYREHAPRFKVSLLLRCPCCRGRAQITLPQEMGALIQCQRCGVKVERGVINSRTLQRCIDMAARAWNTRP